MPKLHIIRESKVERSARVMQVEGMFDVPVEQKQRLSWDVDLPLDFDWSVGLIVGPSGSGKSTVAREVFGDAIVSGFDWAPDKALIDNFPTAMETKKITALLSAVGFSTVPAWLRPFGVLSNGEQFRATIARALAERDGLVVVDEFTSVVDRQVAQVASHAVQKTVRRAKRQLVAVTCHYDVLDWLQPDWVYEPHTARFERRCLQRHPRIDISVHRVDRSAWAVFAPHHYLSARLHSTARCFGAFLTDGRCVGFTSCRPLPHPVAKNIMLEHRTVVLPDFQGLGIGNLLSETMGQILYGHGWRLRAVIAHPALIRARMASPRWRSTRTVGRTSGGGVNAAPSINRSQKVFSVEYRPASNTSRLRALLGLHGPIRSRFTARRATAEGSPSAEPGGTTSSVGSEPSPQDH